MEFAKAIEAFTAAEIAAKLGCPERIVYAWKVGERQPRPWMQRLILKELGRPTKHDRQPARKP